MEVWLYDLTKISKGHFAPKVGMMSYLEFSLSKKKGGGGGLDIIQLSYSSVGIIFAGNFYGEMVI